MKITAICGMGIGSSFMLEMNIKKILAELNVQAEVTHTDIASLPQTEADIFIASKALAKNIEVPCIYLSSVINTEEIKEKLSEEFKKRGIL